MTRQASAPVQSAIGSATMRTTFVVAQLFACDVLGNARHLGFPDHSKTQLPAPTSTATGPTRDINVHYPIKLSFSPGSGHCIAASWPPAESVI
jgi:hypothetical protein